MVNTKTGVVLLSLVAVLLMVEVVAAADSMIGYRSNTGSCATNLLNCPKVREWDTSSGTWGNERELATAGSPVREAVMRQSPVSNKKVLVTQSDDGWLDAYVCTNNCDVASSWVVANNIGQVWLNTPSPNSRRFDVEFESRTGDALLVYGVYNSDTSMDLAYRVLPAVATAWGFVSYINDAGHATDIQYSWVELARDPVASSEELALVAFDSTDSDINAWVWSGSSWGNYKELTAAATATGGYEALAVEYEADGGNALAMGGDSTSGLVKYSAWSGSAWSSVFSFDIDSGDTLDAWWLTLKADPFTDDLQLVVVDSGADLHTAYSSGTSWTVTSNIDTALDVSATRGADFAWEPTGNKGLLVWDTDPTGTTLSYRGCAPQCTGTTKTASGFDGNGGWISMSTNPTSTDSVRIIGTRLNSNNDGGSFKYNGGIIDFGETAISADLAGSGYEGGLMGGSFALAVGGVTADAFAAFKSSNINSLSTDCDELSEAARCPRLRVWDADNNAGAGEWSTSETLLPTIGGSGSNAVSQIIVKASPVSSRVVVVTEGADGDIDGFVCNKDCDQEGSWTKTDNLGDVWATAPGPSQRRFDVDFESDTGDVLLVFAPEDTVDGNDLKYVTLAANSNSWDTATPIPDSTSGTADLQYTWISLARNPKSNAILIAGIDTTDNDASAWIWDGSSLGSQQEFATNVVAAISSSGYDTEALATAWSADGTDAMAIVGDGTTGDLKWTSWDGSSWSSGAFDVDTGDSNDVFWLTLKADPYTDDMMAVILAASVWGAPYDLHTNRWTGSVWDSVTSNHMASSYSVVRQADFAWDPTSSTGKLMWDEDGSTTTNMHYRNWTGSAWSPAPPSSPTTTAAYSGSTIWLQMHTNPLTTGAVKILGLRESTTLGSLSWNGIAFVNYGDSIVRTGSGVSQTEAFSLDLHSRPDAIAAYRSNTDPSAGNCGSADALNCPKIKVWDPYANSWGSEIELSTAGSPVREAVVKRSPHPQYRKKTVIVTASDDGWLDMYVCMSNCGSASSWTVTNNVGLINFTTVPAYRGFDFEFETTSGIGLLVNTRTDISPPSPGKEMSGRYLFANEVVPDPVYQIISDSDTSTDNYYTWIDLERNPAAGSDEIILVGFDRTYDAVEAFVWPGYGSGGGWGNQQNIVSSASATGDRQSFAVKYAADGSKAVVVAGDGTTGSMGSYYWASGAWTAVTAFDIDASDAFDTTWVTLKEDPATDDLMATIVDSDKDLHTALWSGSSWGTIAEHDTDVDVVDQRAADFEWNPSGSEGQLVWDTDSTTSPEDLESKAWASGSWSASSSPTAATFAGSGGWIALSRNPAKDKVVRILGGRLNSNFDVGSLYYDDSLLFSNHGDSALTADTTVATYEAFNTAFRTDY